MKMETVDEVQERLWEAEAHYRAVEEKHNQTIEGVPTAERVLAQVESRAELAEAARVLLEARRNYVDIEQETTEKRRERARAELEVIEAELIEAVEQLESTIETLKPSIGRVLDLSKKRYAFRQEATGRAPRSLLARNATHGWLVWHLSEFDLPDMDHAPHHYRAPLAELLGLDSKTSETNDDGGDR